MNRKEECDKLEYAITLIEAMALQPGADKSKVCTFLGNPQNAP